MFEDRDYYINDERCKTEEKEPERKRVNIVHSGEKAERRPEERNTKSERKEPEEAMRSWVEDFWEDAFLSEQMQQAVKAQQKAMKQARMMNWLID